MAGPFTHRSPLFSISRPPHRQRPPIAASTTSSPPHGGAHPTCRLLPVIVRWETTSHLLLQPLHCRLLVGVFLLFGGTSLRLDPPPPHLVATHHGRFPPPPVCFPSFRLGNTPLHLGHFASASPAPSNTLGAPRLGLVHPSPTFGDSSLRLCRPLHHPGSVPTGFCASLPP